MIPPSLVSRRTNSTEHPSTKYVAYSVPPASRRYVAPISGGRTGFSSVGGHRALGKSVHLPPTSGTVISYTQGPAGPTVSKRASAAKGYGGCCSFYDGGGRSGCPGPVGLNDASVMKKPVMTTSGLIASRITHPTGVNNSSCHTRCRASGTDYAEACKDFTLCSVPCGPHPVSGQSAIAQSANKALSCTDNNANLHGARSSSGKCCLNCGSNCCQKNGRRAGDCVKTFGAVSSSDRTRILRARTRTGRCD